MAWAQMVLHFGRKHRRLFYLMTQDRYQNYYDIGGIWFPYEWHHHYRLSDKDWGGGPKPKVGPIGMRPGKPGMGPQPLGAKSKTDYFGSILYVDILGPVVEITEERCFVLTIRNRRSFYL